LSIIIGSLDLDKDRFKVVNSKGGKSRDIGINQDLRPYFDKYLDLRPKSQNNNVFLLSDGRSLTVDRLEKRISKICKDAGFNTGLHQFRRGMITHYANKSVPITHLQRIAGHSSFSTTLGYCKPELEEILRRQVNW
jgi:site-specific recombinase XerC